MSNSNSNSNSRDYAGNKIPRDPREYSNNRRSYRKPREDSDPSPASELFSRLLTLLRLREIFSGENLLIAAVALSPLLLTLQCGDERFPATGAAEHDSEEICWNPHDCAKQSRIYGRNGDSELSWKTAVKACDLGSGEGCYLQGSIMIREAREVMNSGNSKRSVRDRLRRGVEKVQEGCNTGFAPACQMMADLTEKGTGTAKNPGRAGDFRTRACNMGLVETCLQAALYQWGRSDHKKTWELARKACESGNDEGCAVYAIAAENTNNPDPPRIQRETYHRRGCDSYKIPGSCYLFGFGSADDRVRLEYFEKACSYAGKKQFCDTLEKEKKRQGVPDTKENQNGMEQAVTAAAINRTAII